MNNLEKGKDDFLFHENKNRSQNSSKNSSKLKVVNFVEYWMLDKNKKNALNYVHFKLKIYWDWFWFEKFTQWRERIMPIIIHLTFLLLLSFHTAWVDSNNQTSGNISDITLRIMWKGGWKNCPPHRKMSSAEIVARWLL